MPIKVVTNDQPNSVIENGCMSMTTPAAIIAVAAFSQILRRKNRISRRSGVGTRA
jgi:hypothetical protein